MQSTELTVSRTDFENGTGWQLRPEACSDTDAALGQALFWCGPSDDDPDGWPYASERLAEVKTFAAEYYFAGLRP